MRWTEREDDVIFECGYRGAEHVAREILRRFGIVRTPRAVQMRASRIHASLALRRTCPVCGATGVWINKTTGMCRLCSDRYHLEQARAVGEALEGERAAAEDPDALAEVRREWDAQRKRNSRARKRLRGSGGVGGNAGDSDGV